MIWDHHCRIGHDDRACAEPAQDKHALHVLHGMVYVFLDIPSPHGDDVVLDVAVIASFASLVLCFFALIFPAWFQQAYTPNGGGTTFQGFGLFAFYSTNMITQPFYASQTTLYYADFCAAQDAGKAAPNWMLGLGTSFANTLCGPYITAIQWVMYVAIGFAGIAFLAAIVACFHPTTGYAERTISSMTFLSSLCLLAALILWSVYFQQQLLNTDVIQSAYSNCKANTEGSGASWSCWFYGYCFWVAIAAVVSLLLTTYASAAGRNAKIRHFRKEYEAHMVMAIQESALTAPMSTTRTQPLLTPSVVGATSTDRDLALALQQSREQHDLELAIQESLRLQPPQGYAAPPMVHSNSHASSSRL
ncbi:Aste57867_10216 [Aphanomyces stellatus]|uniref:Aste57867_10216 protein n=1 Tax=Aphanomyces stellatus TaxID=120398 RepID=A0A485KPT0_9STRA|nr:hypothetical protein As57867_010177 [Aphanomyces stellatus]VFT87092.1 Aste57867_10216 [Aphanomyces stellatus]